MTNSNIQKEHEAIIFDALRAKALWQEKRQFADAAALAIIVLVRAYEANFFDDDVNLRNWHKAEVKEEASYIYETILEKLFLIEIPEPADKQRLRRIRFIVPAIIKAGGLRIIRMSSNGQLMVDVSTEYFKFHRRDIIVGGVGAMCGLSIKNLDNAAKSYLEDEIPWLEKQEQVTKTARIDRETVLHNLHKLPDAVIADYLKKSLDNKKSTDISAREWKAYRTLLDALLPIFQNTPNQDQT